MRSVAWAAVAVSLSLSRRADLSVPMTRTNVLRRSVGRSVVERGIEG